MSVGFNTTSIDKIIIPDNLPSPNVIDDATLAFRIGFSPKAMWYAILKPEDHYTVHYIPKQKGGHRIIHAPSDMMKLLSTRLNTVFLEDLQEELGPHVTAYRSGKSIVDAVSQHVPDCPICDKAEQTPPKHDCPRRGTFIKMDLKDFFPSTRRSWVRNYFKELGYSHYVSGLLASLMTVVDLPNKNFRRGMSPEGTPEYFAGVPQGAPTSGAICNLVADRRLDQPVLKYLSTLNADDNWVYTRYADDLTFTCDKQYTKPEVNVIVEELRKVIDSSGYRTNKKKMRVGNNR